MNTKEMLKIALRRGPCCSVVDCGNPATYGVSLGHLCDDHTYITHERWELPDASQVREIMDFIRQED